MNQEFRLKKIDEIRNYLIEEINRNEYTLPVTNDVMYNSTSKRGGTWRFKTLMRCIAR